MWIEASGELLNLDNITVICEPQKRNGIYSCIIIGVIAYEDGYIRFDSEKEAWNFYNTIKEKLLNKE